jgi:hypothetical protein
MRVSYKVGYANSPVADAEIGPIASFYPWSSCCKFSISKASVPNVTDQSKKM